MHTVGYTLNAMLNVTAKLNCACVKQHTTLCCMLVHVHTQAGNATAWEPYVGDASAFCLFENVWSAASCPARQSSTRLTCPTQQYSPLGSLGSCQGPTPPQVQGTEFAESCICTLFGHQSRGSLNILMCDHLA